MARSMRLITSFGITFLIGITVCSTVLGCGLLPFGQERILRFNVTGFTLALPMVYANVPAPRTHYPNISRSATESQSFIHNLIMMAVYDVLQQQGRSAGLSDAAISIILDQLTVNITYQPLKCDSASDGTTTPAQMALRMDMKTNCNVVSNTVTSICTMMACDITMNMNIAPVPPQHFAITGVLRITNSIMANWSDQMWRTILNRVARVLASGPFGANFLVASVSI